MKKVIFIITGLFMLLQLGCRLEELEVPVTNCMDQGFEKKYDYGFNNFTARDIVETTDGDYVICGSVSGSDIFLLKIDKDGNQLFFRRDEQANGENAEAIARTADGGFLVCGRQGENAFFVKYDENGERQGGTTSTLPDSESRCNHLTALGNDRFVFTSDSRIEGPGTRQPHVGIIEIENNQPSITQEYFPFDQKPQISYAAIPTDDGNYAVVGESDANSTPTQAYFFLLDQNMELIEDSERYYTVGGGRNIARDIIKTDDDSYLLTGQVVNGNRNAFVAKVNANGDNIQTMFSGSGVAEADGYSIISGHDEHQEYLIAGDTWESPDDNNPHQVYVAKIDNTGNPIWERDFGTAPLNERALSIISTRDCGYVLLGFEGAPATKAYIIKINEDGNIQ